MCITLIIAHDNTLFSTIKYGYFLISALKHMLLVLIRSGSLMTAPKIMLVWRPGLPNYIQFNVSLDVKYAPFIKSAQQNRESCEYFSTMDTEGCHCKKQA